MTTTTTTKKTNQKQKPFVCTQAQLYIICSLVWKYYLEKLADFAALRPLYTRQFGDDAIAAVTAAQNLYNLQQRNMITSGNRKKAIAAVQVVCANFRTLKVSIKKAFTGADRTSSLVEAGSAYYVKANRNDWQALNHLVTSSTAFIELYKDELKQNNNMTDESIKKYMDDAATCTALLETFKDSTVNKRVGTITKLSGDLAIYEAATLMMEDGRNLFFSDKASKVKFVFKNLYKIVKSQSPASIKGYILDINGKPVAGASVIVQKVVVITNKKGYFSYNRLAGDTPYMVEVTKPNFIDIYEGVILKPGYCKASQPHIAARSRSPYSCLHRITLNHRHRLYK